MQTKTSSNYRITLLQRITQKMSLVCKGSTLSHNSSYQNTASTLKATVILLHQRMPSKPKTNLKQLTHR